MTWDCCLKRAFLSRAVLVAVGRRAIPHADPVADRRELSFPAGTGHGWRRAGWGEEQLVTHCTLQQQPGGDTRRVTTALQCDQK